VRLEEDENVILAVSSGRAFARYLVQFGYLTLTSRRIIFTGPRTFTPPFLKWLSLVQESHTMELAEVRRCRLEDTSNPLISFLRLSAKVSGGIWNPKQAVVIESEGGRRERYWPRMLNPEGLADRIEEARRSGA
jgi:hypothetical protein